MAKTISEILSKIFKSSESRFGLAVFGDINPEKVFEVSQKEKGKFYIKCLKRDKDILVYNEEKDAGKPEEIVRQLMLYKLQNQYKYPMERMDVEVDVQFGRDGQDDCF